MDEDLRVGAVIVTHRSKAPLRRSLASLRQHEPHLPLVVVDSGSPDGPPEVVDVPIVGLETNVGFGAACNVGARELDEVDAYLFLNPDVRLAGPSVTELAARMGERRQVGIATGPIVDPEGRRVPSAWGPTSVARAFWFASGWQLPRLRRVVGRWVSGGVGTSGASLARHEVHVDGHVLGGAMMVRRTCFEELGGFDEGFFLYWEDADLCERSRSAGWEVAVLPCTPLVHEAGTSSEGVQDAQRWHWYLDGADRFARKHLDDRQRRRLMAAFRFGRMLRRPH